jgi:hypothetical protein
MLAKGTVNGKPLIGRVAFVSGVIAPTNIGHISANLKMPTTKTYVKQ